MPLRSNASTRRFRFVLAGAEAQRALLTSTTFAVNGAPCMRTKASELTIVNGDDLVAAESGQGTTAACRGNRASGGLSDSTSPQMGGRTARGRITSLDTPDHVVMTTSVDRQGAASETLNTRARENFVEPLQPGRVPCAITTMSSG